METDKPNEKSVRSYLRSILHSSTENNKANRNQPAIDEGESMTSAIDDQENVCSTQQRTIDEEHKLKSGRRRLLNILNTFDDNSAACSSRLPLMPANTQSTQASSKHPANNQGASIEDSFKALSIREKLRRKMVAQLNITDLDFDCLEHIFDDLSFQHLINVAGTCKYLQSNAIAYFTFHVKHHEVIINCDAYPRYTVRMQSNRWPNEFNGRDFEAFLFAFSEVITKLTIVNLHPLDTDDLQLKTNAKIERLIAQAFIEQKNLRELKFIQCGPRAMQSYTSLAFGVESVAFERCVLGDSALNWPKLFPRMQKLAVIDCNVSQVRECIEKPFPHLKCFDLTASFANENSWFDDTFSIPNVRRAIDENPGIEKMALCYWNDVSYDAKLLKYAAEHLASLQSLHLWHLKYTEFFSEGAIEFSSVQKFTLSNDYYHPERLHQNLASLTFHALEKFHFTGHYDAECVTFLARHQSIQKFVCRPYGPHTYYPTDFDLRTFGIALPQLKVLCIIGNRLTPAGLIQFISDCATVALVKVRNVTFSSAVRERFGKECKERGWKVSYADNIPSIVMKKI